MPVPVKGLCWHVAEASVCAWHMRVYVLVPENRIRLCLTRAYEFAWQAPASVPGRCLCLHAWQQHLMADSSQILWSINWYSRLTSFVINVVPYRLYCVSSHYLEIHASHGHYDAGYKTRRNCWLIKGVRSTWFTFLNNERMIHAGTYCVYEGLLPSCGNVLYPYFFLRWSLHSANLI